jgi:hypothetical protein
MRAATPMASGFVAYLIGLGSFAFLMRKARDRFRKSKYLIATLFMVGGLLIGFATTAYNNAKLNAQELQAPQPANAPVGTATGIFPGRVVWVHDPAVTDENCTNDVGDYWTSDENTDPALVSAMLSSSLQTLSGASSDAAAWEAIFKYYNNAHGKGDVGYTSGEKIVIKINLNGNNNAGAAKNINTSPQICYAILDQLVNNAGVAQADIHIGDPNVSMDNTTYGYLHTDFPDVKYWGTGGGRTNPTGTASSVLFNSDGTEEDKLPQAYVDAAYMINIPVFKKHHRAGISISSKNHFGSLAPYKSGAWHQHYSLPCPDATSEVTNGDYGVYRCFVDIMGHKDLGGKTILYLVDGLWGSTNWGHPPIKWAMSPFNNDWPSSLFLSLDPVAIESVCYDFLYEEFDENHPTEGEFEGDNKGPYAQFSAADDFLHQAADPANWPAGISYDPENDGSVLTSMGAHEHWNNSSDKQYSRNLGTGNGIELTSSLVITANEVVEYIPEGFDLYSNYPNPFSESTTIRYHLAVPSEVQVLVYNSAGQLMHQANSISRTSGLSEYTWDGTTNAGSKVPSGAYLCIVRVTSERGSFEMSTKMLVAR